MVAIVQSASNTGLTSPITITLGAGTTATNCLLGASEASGNVTNPTISGITLGGAADNFSQLATVGDSTTSVAIVEIWADPSCAGGQTSVVVTYSAAPNSSGAIWVYEASGIAASSILDKSSKAFTTGTQATWDSGATATTTQASELWFGADCGFNTTITGPASPWNNSTVLTSGPGPRKFIAGYQIVSSTGTADYSGTYSPNSFETAVVVTLFAAGGAAPSGTVQPVATVPVPRRKPGRVRWAQIAGQAFVAVPAPLQPARQYPRRTPARAYVRFTPVTTNNARPPGTIQPLTAQPAPRHPPRARAYVRFIPVATVNQAFVPVIGGNQLAPGRTWMRKKLLYADL